MKIVMAAAECAPFAKAGGLADVIGALPLELVKLGHEVQVIIPKYSLIHERYQEQFRKMEVHSFEFKEKTATYTMHELVKHGVQFLFLENDSYFERDSIYGPDDAERYAFFTRAVLDFLARSETAPDVVHVHDWHTAVLPFLLKEDPQYQQLSSRVKTMLTIHNIQFQGNFSKSVFLEQYRMDESFYDNGQVEWHGNFNSLKTGILYADKLTTVSPNYRDEILTEAYGEGLQHLLGERETDLQGILNGIDTDAYDPQGDEHIAQTFSAEDLQGKQANKRAIQKRCGLPEQPDVPLLTMISRLSGQKGIDVLEQTLLEFLEGDVQFVLLGSGEARFEEFFQRLEVDYAGKVSVHLGFDESFAHQLYAGADIFLMPSHFEPCGLSQLISMRYGTIPVANRTGGLRDTVEEYDEVQTTGTGFLSDFKAGVHYDEALSRALSFYHQPEHWKALIHNGMKRDSSWSRSAKDYEQLYASLN
ncbi:glycogen synthase [Planococcus maritimus]|uniref:glycogen synthase n=1 Tax=Planococcus maritimus TaxID=192421 RepID=UPI00079A4630|nr:glycogen synthase [Planococcus maritimus]KYG57765.1 starch synthase [Planococcus maritimus]OED31517.1 starch synthase [Planococcus maritimus]